MLIEHTLVLKIPVIFNFKGSHKKGWITEGLLLGILTRVGTIVDRKKVLKQAGVVHNIKSQ